MIHPTTYAPPTRPTKIRVASLTALDQFLEETKMRKVIERSHSMLALRSVKETARLPIAGREGESVATATKKPRRR